MTEERGRSRLAQRYLNLLEASLTCAKAVHDFRERHAIASPILPIDGRGTYWRVDHEPIR